MRGILVCENHKAWGLRDIRASWHRSCKVSVVDLISACPELAQAGLDPNGFAYRQDDGKWFVPMATCGLEAELEGSIRTRLEDGIYKADEMAFQAAVVLEKERHALALADAAKVAEAKKQAAAAAAAAAAKQKQEALGRTRLGESKEEMFRRLTGAVLVKTEVSLLEKLPLPSAVMPCDDGGGWTLVTRK
jgi:hypothetical protein